MMVPTGTSLHLGDLLVGQAGFGKQDKSGTYGGVKVFQGHVDQSSKVVVLEVLGRVFEAELQVLDDFFSERHGGSSAAAAAEVEGGVGDDTQEPGTEAASAVELVEVPDGFEEAILHGVLRVLIVAQEAERDAIRDAKVASEEFLPRGKVTVACLVE